MCEEVWYVNTSQGAPLTLFSGQSSETSVGPQRAVSFLFTGPALILLLICHVSGGGAQAFRCLRHYNQWFSVLVGHPPFYCWRAEASARVSYAQETPTRGACRAAISLASLLRRGVTQNRGLSTIAQEQATQWVFPGMDECTLGTP